jgi:hypothetical protein
MIIFRVQGLQFVYAEQQLFVLVLYTSLALR